MRTAFLWGPPSTPQPALASEWALRPGGFFSWPHASSEDMVHFLSLCDEQIPPGKARDLRLVSLDVLLESLNYINLSTFNSTLL